MTDRDLQAEVINRLAKKTGLRAKIDAKCAECIYSPGDPGTWRRQVALCTSASCPLHSVRTSPSGYEE